MPAAVLVPAAEQVSKTGIMNSVLRLEQISKSYVTGENRVDALRGINLEVKEGEFVSIMAPSGSGKSTLMHIIGCLDTPTSGRYLLAGRDVSRLEEAQLAEVRNRYIGFVFQQFHLLTNMTALKNVELPLIYGKVQQHERTRRAMEALARVGLANRWSHRPNQLSGGQQQRVAIARALVTDPKVILADEPTGNLDSASSKDVLDWLSDFQKTGRTVVLITHEPDVADYADRIVSMRDGRIVSDIKKEHVKSATNGSAVAAKIAGELD